MLYAVTNSRLTDITAEIGVIVVPENPNLDAMPATTAVHLRRLLDLGDFTGQFKNSSLVYTNDEKIPASPFCRCR